MAMTKDDIEYELWKELRFQPCIWECYDIGWNAFRVIVFYCLENCFSDVEFNGRAWLDINSGDYLPESQAIQAIKMSRRQLNSRQAEQLLAGFGSRTKTREARDAALMARFEAERRSATPATRAAPVAKPAEIKKDGAPPMVGESPKLEPAPSASLENEMAIKKNSTTTDTDIMGNATGAAAGVLHNTLAVAKDAAIEGAKLATAQQASQILRDTVRDYLPPAYQSAVSSPVGAAAESFLVPMVLHAAVDMIEDVPHKDRVKAACEYAMTAEAKDKLGLLLTQLTPMLRQIGTRLGRAGL